MRPWLAPLAAFWKLRRMALSASGGPVDACLAHFASRRWRTGLREPGNCPWRRPSRLLLPAGEEKRAAASAGQLTEGIPYPAALVLFCFWLSCPSTTVSEPPGPSPPLSPSGSTAPVSPSARPRQILPVGKGDRRRRARAEKYRRWRPHRGRGSAPSAPVLRWRGCGASNGQQPIGHDVMHVPDQRTGPFGWDDHVERRAASSSQKQILRA